VASGAADRMSLLQGLHCQAKLNVRNGRSCRGIESCSGVYRSIYRSNEFFMQFRCMHVYMTQMRVVGEVALHNKFRGSNLDLNIEES